MGRANRKLTVINVSDSGWDVIENLMQRLNEVGGSMSEADVGRRLLNLGIDTYKRTGRLGELHLPWKEFHGPLSKKKDR